MPRRAEIALLTFVLCVSVAFAAENVPLAFTRLDLTDGRRLNNVVVKSYDAKSEKLLIITDGKAMTIPINLLPPPYNQALKKAPASGGFFVVQPTPPRSMPSAADQYNVAAPTTPIQPTPRRGRTVPRERIAPSTVTDAGHQSTASAEKDRIARHSAAALGRATTYFKYEFQAGSNSITATSLDFEMSTPKPIPGWEGRCEIQGKAYIEYFDSRGRSFQRTTSTFEVITEEKPGTELTVVSFSRKS